MRHYGSVTQKPRRIAHTPRGRGGGSGIFNAPIVSIISKSQDEKLDAFEIKRLKAAAELVAERARLISDRFSRRIPLTVRVRGNETGIYIEAGGPRAPNAFPFDPPSNPPVFHPNRARRGSYRYHHSKWFPQPYRPFFEQAAAETAEAAAERFAAIIDDWAKEVGL